MVPWAVAGRGLGKSGRQSRLQVQKEWVHTWTTHFRRTLAVWTCSLFISPETALGVPGGRSKLETF